MMSSTAVVLFGLIAGGSGFQMWDSLRVTWCYDPQEDPEHCFQKVPRTVKEAYSTGWHELSGQKECINDGKFSGRRFVKGTNLAVSPLYDVNGIIAGIQINFLKKELYANGTNPYKYAEVGYYLDNEIAGKPVYSLTIYFVNPKSICHRGRTEEDLNREGTGTSLTFQTGPTPHPRNLLRIPLYRNLAIQQGWSDNLCVPTMGYHNYYKAEEMSESKCMRIGPNFLLFNNAGELFGWGGTSVGSLSSKSFEHPQESAFRSGLGAMAPQCMIDLSRTFGYSNMHMFFIDQPRSFRCQQLVQSPPSIKDPYLNPRSV